MLMSYMQYSIILLNYKELTRRDTRQNYLIALSCFELFAQVDLQQ